MLFQTLYAETLLAILKILEHIIFTRNRSRVGLYCSRVRRRKTARRLLCQE